jgi:hypothetical protein
VPGYRDDAPLAAREVTDASASPAGTPQCRAVRFNLLVVMAGRWPPANRAPATRRAAVMPPGLFVEHLACGLLRTCDNQRDGPSIGPGPKAQLFS